MGFNPKTVFLGCKHVLSVMEPQFEQIGSGGSIISLSSTGHMSHQVGARMNVACGAGEAR